MKEKHVLWYRPKLRDEPVKLAEFCSYREALAEGIRKCGHGKFWVENLCRMGRKWVAFAPEPLRLRDLENPEAEEGMVPVLDKEALEEDLLPG